MLPDPIRRDPERVGPIRAAARPSTQSAVDIVINAPQAGFVLVSAAIGVENSAATCADFACGVFFLLRHTNTGDESPYVVVDVHGGTNPDDTASLTYAFPVEAGNNTFQLHVARFDDTQSPGYFSPQITGLYSPFGSTGGVTLGAADTAAPDGQAAGGQ